MLGTYLKGATLESIAYQANRTFFDEVVKCFAKLKEKKHEFSDNPRRDSKAIEKSGIEKVVNKHTGLNIRFRTGPQYGYNAFVIVPQFDRNHPFFDASKRPHLSSKDSKKAIKEAKGKVEGKIDLDKGTVSGVYSELRSDIFVATQIIKGMSNFTLEECTAIFMHEVGHLITYYEYLGRNYILNHVLGDLTREYAQADSRQHRVEILKVVRRELDLDSLNVDVISEVEKTETIQSIVVSEYANQWVSATNTHLYDYRTWEALADQYVSRLGGARHLATALDRVFRITGSEVYMSNNKFLIVQAMSIFAGILFLPFVILLATMSEPVDTYDPPKERIERLRRDMVNALKKLSLSRERRKELQDDLDRVDAILEGMVHRENILLTIWNTVIPGIRKQTSRTRMIQDLEKLANNDLYVAANKFNTL